MATIKGATVKWGIGTSGLAFDNNQTCLAVFNPQRVRVQRTAKTKQIAGADGETKTVIYYDNVYKISFEAIPLGDQTNSISNTIKLPAIGSKVTITDATDADLAGDWIVEDATKEESNDGETRITLELTKYPNISL